MIQYINENQFIDISEDSQQSIGKTIEFPNEDNQINIVVHSPDSDTELDETSTDELEEYANNLSENYDGFIQYCAQFISDNLETEEETDPEELASVLNLVQISTELNSGIYVYTVEISCDSNEEESPEEDSAEEDESDDEIDDDSCEQYINIYHDIENDEFVDCELIDPDEVSDEEMDQCC